MRRLGKGGEGSLLGLKGMFVSGGHGRVGRVALLSEPYGWTRAMDRDGRGSIRFRVFRRRGHFQLQGSCRRQFRRWGRAAGNIMYRSVRGEGEVGRGWLMAVKGIGGFSSTKEDANTVLNRKEWHWRWQV